jgi:hypothetical protein
MSRAHVHVEGRWEKTKWQIREALGITPEDQDVDPEGMWGEATRSVEEVRDAADQRDRDE